MKIKLNEAIKSYDNFLAIRENKTDAINTPGTTPTETTLDIEVAVSDDTKTDMMSDVDHIITSLETLAGQVQEEIELFKLELLNEESEAINEGPIQWIRGKMLQGKQKKVTTMKLKSSDMSSAAANLQGSENRDKQSYIIDKKKQLDDSIKAIQSMIDDKAKDIGSPAPKIVNREKLKGQMEVIKSQIGNVDPSKAQSMKIRLGDLQGKYKEEGEAIQQLKDKADREAVDVKGDDNTNALRDEIKKLQDEKKKINGSTTNGELEEVMMDIQIYGLKMKKAVEDGDPKTDPSQFDDKIAKLKTKMAELQAELEKKPEPKETDDAAIAAADAEVTKAKADYDAVKDDEDENVKLQAEVKFKQAQQKKAKLEGDDELYKGLGTDIEAIMKKIQAAGTPKVGEPKILDKNTKEGKLKRLQDAMKKAEEAGDTEKIAKIQNLIDRISAKESWQMNGTEFGRLLEMEITKIESEYILNESKYAINSIKDAFAKLI
tara:strand:- start:4064 stop:5530 length:1467 start_codon:yes stop_codon:yes gene_type:complete